MTLVRCHGLNVSWIYSMGQIGYLQNAISLTHTMCVASR